MRIARSLCDRCLDGLLTATILCLSVGTIGAAIAMPKPTVAVIAGTLVGHTNNGRMPAVVGQVVVLK